MRRLADADEDSDVLSRTNYMGSESQKVYLLHCAIARLLAGWPLEDVEVSAWEFALDGWQRTPPLVVDYDIAFQRYSEMLHISRLRLTQPPIPEVAFRLREPGLTAVGTLLEELRNRAQFLQTRAADIRLSVQFERLLDASAQRLSPVLEDLATRLNAVPPAERVDVLVRFDRENRAGLIHAVARALGRHQPEAGATLVTGVSYLQKSVDEILNAFPQGVVDNALYSAVLMLAEWIASNLR